MKRPTLQDYKDALEHRGHQRLKFQWNLDNKHYRCPSCKRALTIFNDGRVRGSATGLYCNPDKNTFWKSRKS